MSDKKKKVYTLSMSVNPHPFVYKKERPFPKHPKWYLWTDYGRVFYGVPDPVEPRT